MPKPGELPTTDKIKDILRLPEGPEGDEKLEKMLSAFSDEFTQRERLFILFYTSPMSKTSGKISRSGAAVGGSFRSWGDWVIRQPHVKQKIDEILNADSLNLIEDIFREDIKFCREVLNCDRTAFKEDKLIDLGEKGSFDIIDDKQLKELTPKQKKMVAGFDYDKNGHAHYSIETRASARQALLNYHKLLSQKINGEENRSTETVVTLEGIRDKATAKISIIQHNKAEAELAGDFIEPMGDLDEEA
jgi:hypothetical protein